MTARFRARLGDIVISSVVVLVGIAGLIKTMDYPERAAMWPSWIMQLMILCAGIHLVIVLWQVRAGAGPEKSPRNEDNAS